MIGFFCVKCRVKITVTWEERVLEGVERLFNFKCVDIDLTEAHNLIENGMSQFHLIAPLFR